VTLRLYARPKIDRTFLVRLAKTTNAATAFLRAFLSAPMNPFAFELLSASAAQALKLADRAVCLIRFGGNPAAVDSQLITLSKIANSEELEPNIWNELRSLEKGSECVIRVSGLPAQFRDASETILSDYVPDVITYVSPVRGSLRLIVQSSPYADSSDDPALGISMDGHPSEQLVFETLPKEIWPMVPSAVSDSLSRGIKNVFDPHNILNPGILGHS
jgi:FAD/FMN-containing dehydrogenase